MAKPSPLRRWTRRLIWLLVLAAIVVFVASAMQPKPVPVDLATVTHGPLVVTVDEDGRTRVRDRYKIAAPLAGNVGRIELRPGDLVEVGVVLARIEPTPPPLLDDRSRAETEARVRSAEAAERQAQAALTRASGARSFADGEARRLEQLGDDATAQELARARFERQGSAQDETSAKFAAQVARYQAEVARVALASIRGNKDSHGQPLEVTAPIAGRVLQILHESEGYVTAGTGLLEIADPSAMEIVVDVLTADAVRIEPGAAATLRAWGGEGELRARVRRIDPAAFTRVSALGVEEQRVNVVLDLVDPHASWQRLGDGFRVDVSIEVWREENAVQVPLSALVRREAGWSTFIHDGDSVHLRPIEVGQQSGLMVQVRGGLEPGERVVIYPSDKVVDGALVADAAG